MKTFTFTFPLLAVIAIFAGMSLAAPSVSAKPVSQVTAQFLPMEGKGDKPAPKPTPTPKPRIGPPKSGDE